MNILVTGANGQLGNHMRRVAVGSNDNYIFTDVAELDITVAEDVEAFVRRHEVDAVVNCAAYTNVDAAEKSGALAELINSKAVGILAGAMAKRGGLLVHISTDYVFGGNVNNTPCGEDEQVNPTGVYGVTKLHGEEMVSKAGCNYIIIRTAWLYSEYGENFVKKILQLTSRESQEARVAAGRPRGIKVVFDQVGTPTYAGDLADAIFEILEKRKYQGADGIYHYSNEGAISWYDFAKAIAQIASRDCQIEPCYSSEFPSPVRRPNYSVLDKRKIKEQFGVNVPYWRDSLARCMGNIK